MVTPEHKNEHHMSQPWHRRLPCLSRPSEQFGLSLLALSRVRWGCPTIPFNSSSKDLTRTSPTMALVTVSYFPFLIQSSSSSIIRASYPTGSSIKCPCE
ncbi:hypothetical protein BD310DRAFT_942423 [Dichomitus squalens]|uniref:Uncharacterized protein n=1 Tax=Dichomitus squalens TaxID=114155 RepID=A0A4Q9PG05_9APHY|nr:hypothetical protein BD310DRAFT_942423 [Dichomitus squalens]